jgi:hypothetical protein
VRIVKHPVDHGTQMLRNRDDEATRWQLPAAQVNRAAGTDVHGGGPSPPESLQISLDGVLFQSRSRVVPQRVGFCRRLLGQCPVDVRVRAARGDRDGARCAVARLTAIAGCRTATIVVVKEQSTHDANTARRRHCAQCGFNRAAVRRPDRRVAAMMRARARCDCQSESRSAPRRSAHRSHPVHQARSRGPPRRRECGRTSRR